MDMATQLQGGANRPPSEGALVRKQFMDLFGVDPEGMSAEQVMALVDTPQPDMSESLGAVPPDPQPELRSANTPVGDAVAQSFGPEAGHIASEIHGAADQVTANPFVEGGGDAVDRAATLAVPFGVGPAARVGKAALSASAPTLSKALIGGGAMGLTAANAGDEASDDPIQSLYTERARLAQQRDAALAEREKEAVTGKGPNYEAANRVYEDLSSKVAGIESMIQAEQAKTSPDAQLELEMKRREMERAQSDQATREELDKPFAERNPELAQALPIAGLAGALLMGRFGAGKIAAKGQSLLDDFERAREAGDVARSAESLAKINRWQKSAPWQSGKYILGGGLVGAEARALPDQFDAIGLPEGSKARDEAREKFADPASYAKATLPSLAMGMATAFSGGKTGPAVSRTDAKGVIDVYGSKPSLSSMAEQLKAGKTLTQEVRQAGKVASPDVVPAQGAAMSNSLRYEKFSNGRSGHRDMATGRFTKKPK